jgi:hypothetical protein
MNEWKKIMATRTVPDNVVSDLIFWVDTLSSYEHTRLIQSARAIEIGWVGDASTSFGIGVLIGHRWCQFKMKESFQGDSVARDRCDQAWRTGTHRSAVSRQGFKLHCLDQQHGNASDFSI